MPPIFVQENLLTKVIEAPDKAVVAELLQTAWRYLYAQGVLAYQDGEDADPLPHLELDVSEQKLTIVVDPDDPENRFDLVWDLTGSTMPGALLSLLAQSLVALMNVRPSNAPDGNWGFHKNVEKDPKG